MCVRDSIGDRIARGRKTKSIWRNCFLKSAGVR